MLDYPLTKESLINNLNIFNVNALEQVEKLNLFEFGLFLELEPEEEEKAMLEQNIQMAIQQNQIYLEDAIDLREIKNVTLANQVLKYKRIKKQEADQKAQQAQVQAQSQANIQASEAAAMQEVQKQQAITQEKVQIEQAKSQFEIQRMQTEAQIKTQLMAEQFQYDLQLAQMNIRVNQQKEAQIEDRKDKRTKIQASQQSQMISQRQNDTLPTDFESAGNDNLGGFGLEQFGP
tara:strand:- start:184 stop:882 length:699 start_codon:yes stop_codon:yes gene_type:complete